MNTGNKNPIAVDEEPSFTQNSLSLPLPFESVRNKYSFLPLNASKSFGAVEYIAQKNTKTDYSINRVLKFLTFQETFTMNNIC